MGDVELLDAQEEGTCIWPVSYLDCAQGCDEVWEQWPEDQREAIQDQFEQAATDFLNAWTNGVFGICTVTVRPCQTGCDGGPSATSTFWGRGPGYDPTFPRYGSGGLSTGGWVPVLIAGNWYNVGCGCAGTCTCTVEGPNALRLPGPIQSITEVLIDGVVLDPSAYRVAYRRVLVRTDGGVWPACQNLLKAAAPESGPALPGEDYADTFQITYERGIAVPVGGQAAAGRLACELAKAACGADDCALPERVQTVTRQGITVGILDSFEDVEKGRTGIWAIDSWLASVNRPIPRATVRSVDVR